jgi:hypothetical protein
MVLGNTLKKHPNPAIERKPAATLGQIGLPTKAVDKSVDVSLEQPTKAQRIRPKSKSNTF